MLTEISEITPFLYLSSGIAVTENNLKIRGVKLVINATKELPVTHLGDDVIVIKIPVSDKSEEDLYRYFQVRQSIQTLESIRIPESISVSNQSGLWIRCK